MKHRHSAQNDPAGVLSVPCLHQLPGFGLKYIQNASRRHYVQQCSLRGEAMKRLMLAVLVIAAIALVVVAEANKKEIVAITPSEDRWFTPPYYTDGRQRA